MKLHLGNGTVYLDGYTNIDMIGLVAKLHPDLVEHNRTTIDNYYKFPFRQNKDNNVSDALMDVKRLCYEDNSVDEILCVNLIDHMPKEEFIIALNEWKRVLKTDGILIIDIDDRRKQAEILTSAETNEEIEWALRLMYCDHAKKGRTHFWGYEPKYLQHIVEPVGFKQIWTATTYIIHDMYPNFQSCFQKV
jgi:SAM-dependent methyltransferase